MSFGCGRASRELKKRNCLASQNFILLTPSSVAESIEFKCNHAIVRKVRPSVYDFHEDCGRPLYLQHYASRTLNLQNLFLSLQCILMILNASCIFSAHAFSGGSECRRSVPRILFLSSP